MCHLGRKAFRRVGRRFGLPDEMAAGTDRKTGRLDNAVKAAMLENVHRVGDATTGHLAVEEDVRGLNVALDPSAAHQLDAALFHQDIALHPAAHMHIAAGDQMAGEYRFGSDDRHRLLGGVTTNVRVGGRGRDRLAGGLRGGRGGRGLAQ